jgi:hypothetical protein
LGHADGSSREVRVIVKAFTERNASGSVTVSRQKREDVIFATVSSGYNVAKIGWQGSVVGSTSSFVVCVRTREAIRQLARTLVHVSFIIWAISDL